MGGNAAILLAHEAYHVSSFGQCSARFVSQVDVDVDGNGNGMGTDGAASSRNNENSAHPSLFFGRLPTLPYFSIRLLTSTFALSPRRPFTSSFSCVVLAVSLATTLDLSRTIFDHPLRLLLVFRSPIPNFCSITSSTLPQCIRSP